MPLLEMTIARRLAVPRASTTKVHTEQVTIENLVEIWSLAICMRLKHTQTAMIISVGSYFLANIQYIIELNHAHLAYFCRG